MNIVRDNKEIRPTSQLYSTPNGVTFVFDIDDNDVYIKLENPKRDGSDIQCFNLIDNKIYFYSENSEVFPVKHEIEIFRDVVYEGNCGGR